MISCSQSLPCYRNVTEELIIEEIDRQWQELPDNVVRTIERTDAIAYALNRLPSMYATTEKGYQWQKQRGKECFTRLISQAAKWGLKAAQRPYKTVSEPLLQPQQTQAEQALQTLKTVLEYDELNWDNLVSVIQQAIQSDKFPPETRSKITPLLATSHPLPNRLAG